MHPEYQLVVKGKEQLLAVGAGCGEHLPVQPLSARSEPSLRAADAQPGTTEH